MKPQAETAKPTGIWVPNGPFDIATMVISALCLLAVLLVPVKHGQTSSLILRGTLLMFFYYGAIEWPRWLLEKNVSNFKGFRCSNVCGICFVALMCDWSSLSRGAVDIVSISLIVAYWIYFRIQIRGCMREGLAYYEHGFGLKFPLLHPKNKLSQTSK